MYTELGCTACDVLTLPSQYPLPPPPLLPLHTHPLIYTYYYVHRARLHGLRRTGHAVKLGMGTPQVRSSPVPQDGSTSVAKDASGHFALDRPTRAPQDDSSPFAQDSPSYFAQEGSSSHFVQEGSSHVAPTVGYTVNTPLSNAQSNSQSNSPDAPIVSAMKTPLSARCVTFASSLDTPTSTR